MPEKDGSEDKKSTKSVVNKKQKQFMNQEEQLDLSSVAESFGGQIVGEPVELDEDAGVISIPTAAVLAKYGIPLAITAIGAYGTSRQMQGKQVLPSIKIPNLGIKDKAKKVFGKIKKVLKPNVEKKADIENPKKVEKKYNYNRRTNNNNQQDIGGPTGGTRGRANNTIDLTKELEKRKRILDQQNSKKNVNQNVFNKTKEKFFGKNKNGSSNKSSKKDLAIAGASGMGLQTAISTLTKGKKGKGFRLGGLPGTAHNVGRRTNPQ